MKSKIKKGQYCIFDINILPDGYIEDYKYGFIKAIRKDDIVIEQKGGKYHNEHYVEESERIRNWKFDIPRGYMEIYDKSNNKVYEI